MDRSKTVDLIPIVWRLGTDEVYRDYPRAQDLATVASMGEGITELLIDWLDDECKIMRTGAAAALRWVAPGVLSRASPVVQQDAFDGGPDGADRASLAFPASRSRPGAEHRKLLRMTIKDGVLVRRTLDLSGQPE